MELWDARQNSETRQVAERPRAGEKAHTLLLCFTCHTTSPSGPAVLKHEWREPDDANLAVSFPASRGQRIPHRRIRLKQPLRCLENRLRSPVVLNVIVRTEAVRVNRGQDFLSHEIGDSRAAGAT